MMIQLGEMRDSLRSEEVAKLFEHSKFELLGPSFRRANCYFEFNNTILCIYAKASSWFVLGDLYLMGEKTSKEFGVDREASFASLYHLALGRNKSILGYYLQAPILFKELRCCRIGFTYSENLVPDIIRGAAGVEIRRAKNLAKRSDKLNFKNMLAKDLSADQKKHFSKTYDSFLSRKIKPLIGFLLAKSGDVWTDKEHLYWVEEEGQVLALISGFDYDDSFYVDRMYRLKDNPMLMDMLMAELITDQRIKSKRMVGLGLCAFYAKPEKLWSVFRRLVKFWYDSERLRSFKRKYSNQELPVYYFVEKRQNHLLQFLKLSLVSVYWRSK